MSVFALRILLSLWCRVWGEPPWHWALAPGAESDKQAVAETYYTRPRSSCRRQVAVSLSLEYVCSSKVSKSQQSWWGPNEIGNYSEELNNSFHYSLPVLKARSPKSVSWAKGEGVLVGRCSLEAAGQMVSLSFPALRAAYLVSGSPPPSSRLAAWYLISLLISLCHLTFSSNCISN